MASTECGHKPSLLRAYSRDMCSAAKLRICICFARVLRRLATARTCQESEREEQGQRMRLPGAICFLQQGHSQEDMLL